MLQNKYPRKAKQDPVLTTLSHFFASGANFGVKFEKESAAKNQFFCFYLPWNSQLLGASITKKVDSLGSCAMFLLGSIEKLYNVPKSSPAFAVSKSLLICIKSLGYQPYKSRVNSVRFPRSDQSLT